MLPLADWALSNPSTKAFKEQRQPAALRAATELAGTVSYYSTLLCVRGQWPLPTKAGEPPLTVTGLPGSPS